MNAGIHKYYVDNMAEAQAARVHKLHRDGCSELPDQNRRLYVGHFEGHDDAFSNAIRIYSGVELCSSCCGGQPEILPPDIALIENGQIILVKVSRVHDLQEAQTQLEAVLAFSKKHRARLVLYDFTEAESLPGTFEIYKFASEFPKHLKLAGVAEESSPCISDLQFTENVLVNRGIQAGIFFKYDQAVAWLLG